jgi:predicted dehydrogenase
MLPDPFASKFGVGIVGAGLIGRKRAAALPPDMQLISVYDVTEISASSLAAEHLGCAVSATYEEMLADARIDVLVVAITHDRLAEVSLRAVMAGKHVLVEKPAGVTSGELTQVRNAAAERELVVRVGFNHRFHPSFLRIQTVLAERDVGKLLWIRARYGHGGRRGYEQEWRADASRSGGGELIDQGSHLIDLVRFLVGPADLAYAHLPTSFWNMQVEDNAFLALAPRSGGFAWLHASWTEWKNTFSFEACFEHVKLEVNGLGGSYGTERLTMFEMAPEMGPPATTTWEFPFPDRSWETELIDVVRSLRKTPSIGASIDDAIETMQIIEEAYGR